jgi:hypothetical protein
MLKQVVSALKMVPMADAVHIPFVAQFLDDQRVLQPNDVMEGAATALLSELSRWTLATGTLRGPRD